MSAFAPARNKSDPSPNPHAQLMPDDYSFVTALREAGMAGELEGTELARAARHVHSAATASRRIELLDAYYAAAGDPIASQRRQATDRWFLYAADERLTASQVIHRLLGVAPELSGVRLERVGGSSGMLVVRTDDHVCAIEDERQEQEPDVISISVRDLVRAVNVLLERQGVRARLVGLFGDGAREAYLGFPSMVSVIPLANADYLAPPDVETLMELTGW